MTKADLPVHKNESYEVDIVDLTHEGAGVARVNGFTLFVPNTLPGERAKIKVIGVKKGFGFGRLEELIEESPERVEPPCPIYKWCGGCQLQHLSYEGQLEYKRKLVEDVLTRIGKIDDVPVLSTLGMGEEPWRYRNKAQVPVGERNGRIITGFYQKRSHEIVEMDSCIITGDTNDDAVQAVKEIVNQYNISAYNEEKHKGVLRHIIARYGKTTGDLMIVLVTNGQDLPQRKKIVEDIREALPEIKSIVQNVNSKRTNVIFGEETRVLWGAEYIYDFIGDIKFAISARSFYQINPDQTKVLYDQALHYAELNGNETVIDAYCGIGTISLFLAQKAKKVYGVEIVPEAIEDARRNAELNNIHNAEFAVGKSEDVIPEWKKQGVTPDVIVVDPPRKGCDEELLKTIIEMKPNRVVYVSCNPATLARDLRILEDGGFKTVEVQPVDMFPQTTHVEAVALLKLNES
ncbi:MULTISPECIES: 23S rRNA (uracil(1939)-C(5))-methyltransferase RlmD [Fictibacillus]|uniref:23S rRNA (uracil(1939)-C(5))-methyltransferase RlmD n=1 Tax=Fictibacillus TaxID=1329200 RepID=UPI0011A78295|nr:MULTISPECIES: 23S rRNA (uracil(1939)-C(5))-methyltransferase RlmD [Fictibacillus]MBH0171205.1 23S rRNA (uracil(1939)-C(5))-methyltransferase RlmD [Fictibacillus sp. 18YEL24]